jgi:formate dehydrogenase gamma subunit
VNAGLDGIVVLSESPDDGRKPLMDNSPTQRWVRRTCLALVCCAAGIVRAGAPVHTGSQANYPHRIQLFDEKGQLITAKSTEPFSTRKTCGKCHDYESISGGWHFQAGLRENDGKDPNRPVDARPGEPYFLTDPTSHTQIPTSHRRWARKAGTAPADLGLSAFDFALRFGAYSPGGGMLENTIGKDGKIERLSGEPWDKTGVLEIDCLMCHLRTGYNAELRAEHIGYQNFKWAGTAAAGLGIVLGEARKAGKGGGGSESADPFEIETSEEKPAAVNVKVEYDPARFDKGNFVVFDVTRYMPNTNCMFCHYNRLRGEPGGVNHQRIRDIHFEAGLLCTDCHKNAIDHRITRGDGSPADLARSPDNASLSCRGCHEAGRAAAPKDDHPGLPAFHLKRISCVACHSGFKPGPVVSSIQTAMADRLGLSTEEDLSKRPPAMYAPVWRDEQATGEISLQRYVYPRWYGLKTDKGITPLPQTVVSNATKEVGGADKDEGKDGKSEAKICAVLTALAKSLEGKNKGAKPVLLARGGVYELEGSGKLAWTVSHKAEPYYWDLAHPVRPARESLGSGGCTDCHDEHAPFYMIRTVVDERTEPSPPIRSYNLLGTTEANVDLGEFREEFVKTGLIWLIPGLAFLCMLHYVTFGPKRVNDDDPDATVRRFGILERFMHLVLLLAFLALGATGLGFLLAKLPNAHGSFWTSHPALELHEIAGLIFAGATVVVVLRWFITAIPASYDWQWIRMLGGYLWIKGHPPAGKFNFGQKMFYWVSMVLAVVLSVTGITIWLKPGGDGGWATVAYTLHDLAAVLLLAGAVVHVYLGWIANPGTVGAIFTGSVTKAWAHNHHPNWAEKIDGGAGTGKP